MDSNIFAKTIADAVLSYSNPEMQDPDESKAIREMTENGLRQAASVTYQKQMQEREQKELERKFLDQERTELLEYLRTKVQTSHGDRLLLDLDSNAIEVMFSRDGKNISREEAHAAYLDAFKVLRKLTSFGTSEKPSEKDAKLIVKAAEDIDKLTIEYRKRRPNGSYATYTLKGLTSNLGEEEAQYIKYAHFSFLDKTSCRDIAELRSYYANGKKTLRDQEYAALCTLFLAANRRGGAPVNDPSQKTLSWSKMVPGLTLKIPDYAHAGHLPLRFDLVLPYLAQSGFIIYSASQDRNYTAQDLVKLTELPKDLRFVSLATKEEYSLDAILRSPEMRAMHSMAAAASDNVEEFMAYWNHELRSAKALAAMEVTNRERIQHMLTDLQNNDLGAYTAADLKKMRSALLLLERNEARRQKLQHDIETNATQALTTLEIKQLLLAMEMRKEYEMAQIQKQVESNRQKETQKLLLGEFDLSLMYQTLADSVASIFGIQETMPLVGRGMFYADGHWEIKEQYEYVPDPTLEAQRPDQYTVNGPRTWMPMLSFLSKIVPPLAVGYESQQHLAQIAAIKQQAQDILETEQQELAKNMNQYEEALEEQERRVPAGTVAGVTAGVLG